MNLYATGGLIVSVAGVLAGFFVGAPARSIRAGVSVTLALWTAATLLRLSADVTWPALGGAAALIGFRKLVGGAIRD